MGLILTSLNESARIGGFDLQGDVCRRLAVYLEEMGQDFIKQANIVHRKSVFQILIRIMRLCPVDTGRLRGSFTTYLQSRGNRSFWQYAEAAPIGSVPPRETPKKGFSAQAFLQGQTQGEFTDSFMNTVIGTNVNYALYVDEKTSFMSKALIWGDTQYRRNFEQFLKITALKGAVVDPIPTNDDGQKNS